MPQISKVAEALRATFIAYDAEILAGEWEGGEGGKGARELPYTSFGTNRNSGGKGGGGGQGSCRVWQLARNSCRKSRRGWGGRWGVEMGLGSICLRQDTW